MAVNATSTTNARNFDIRVPRFIYRPPGADPS
jgi:hypothetical protein